jgi:tetratricopeptide (TPR) repeat protein
MITHADLKKYGMADIAQSFNDDGIANYIKILKIKITDANSLVIEGINEANDNQFDKALKKFEEAIAENPYDVDALLRAAFVYEYNKNHDQAIAYYQKIGEIQPNDPYIQLRPKAKPIAQSFGFSSRKTVFACTTLPEESVGS